MSEMTSRLESTERSVLLGALRLRLSPAERTVWRLAALTPMAYDQVRLAKAKQLRVRVRLLDRKVAQARRTLARAAAAEARGAEVQELLGDIRGVLAETGADRIASRELVAHLVALPQRPWGTWSGGRPLSPAGLAARLRPVGIRPRMRAGRGGTAGARGYERHDFTPPGA